MNQNQTSRSQKSITWMVTRLVFHIIGFGIILGVPLQVILWYLSDKVPAILLTLFGLVASALVTFIAVKMAFKVIVKQSLFLANQIHRLGFGLVSVVVVLQALTIILEYKINTDFSLSLSIVGQYFLWDVILFFIVTYWGKKAVNSN